MADADQIQGLPPGAELRPIGSASTAIQGLPPGAELRPIGSQPQHDYSSLTHNPNGEGTYKVTTPDGQTLDVPYSNVPVFTHGLQGMSFASPAEEARFNKDAAADPHRPSFWNTLTNEVDEAARTTPYSTDKGIGGNAAAALNNLGAGAVGLTLEPIVHPVETAKGIVKGFSSLPAEDGGTMSLAGYTPPQPKRTWGQAGADATAMVPGLIAGNEFAPEAAGLPKMTASPELQALMDEFNSAPGRVGAAAKRVVTGDIHAPIPGTDITPAERYDSMTRMGVQPNAAEATNSGLLKAVEQRNENSLTTQRMYADARAENLKALQDHTKKLLDSMSDKGDEEGGAAVQQGLRAAQKELQNQSTEGFDELGRQTGNRLLNGQTLQATAKNIYDTYSDYYKNHPELAPGNAWKVVRDLAGADTTPAFQARPMRFPEVQQLRSDLLELVRSNPDIVKNQAGGWLQRLADSADATMTRGESGLSPEGVQLFRDANEAWGKMKGTYDNPQHPFYNAVRTPSPSTLLGGMQQTPEMARMLQEALGPEGIGPIQRGVVEKLLRTTKEGPYNFKTFQGNWNKLRPDYRNSLFTPEQIGKLEDIGNVGTLLHEDLNPSGTAKMGQGLAEMGEGGGAATSAFMGHPMPLIYTGAYHAAQYLAGRLMNSPKFVDWLMRDSTAAPSVGGAKVIDPMAAPDPSSHPWY